MSNPNAAFKLFDLSGKTALVTGGATGIGAAIATTLAGCGANIAVTTNTTPATAVEEKLADMGRPFHSYTIDLAAASPEELEQLVEGVEADSGEIDILVNNAGIIRRAPAVDHSLADWDAVIGLNLTACWQLTQIVGQRMLKRGSGKVIMIASMLSYQGGINIPGYTASKHAIAGLTKALANEWASGGVNVNAIAPGYIETAATEGLRSDETRSASILSRIPAGRWGQASDIGGAAAFLAADAANYINGHILAVDGGWLAR